MDRCPGALSVFAAADGGLARVRLPGGFVSAVQLGTIAAAARDLGTGVVELTSRGNVQIRGLAAGAELQLGQRLAEAGLLPSESHEIVRNIVASPLAGIDTDVDLGPVVAELDRALCATPALSGLPGRFLFALDDGRGDVAALGADVTAVVIATSARVEGVEVEHAVPAMLAVAEAFLAERTARQAPAWRIEEIGRADVLARAAIGIASASHVPDAPAHPAGRIAQPDGISALVALAPLGRLTAAQVDRLAIHTAGRDARITPWRSIVLPDLSDVEAVAADLTDAGLGVDDRSKWVGVSACTGRPGCAQALADVQADASENAQRWPGRIVHWSGCERRCGRPRDASVDVVAAPNGYAVTEMTVRG
ncbi:MAG: precorrin-3B synthase [Pseudonocardiales bacterium]|nr:precorrin-3B synthase [Pseudonocardiales bacterium]